MSLIFRQLIHYGSCTYTYLLGCGATRKALLIDPVLECADRDVKLLSELNLDLQYTLNTHIHADHVRNCGLMKQKLPNLDIKSIDGSNKSNADIHVGNNDIINFGDSFELKCLHTPGHTADCFCYLFKYHKHQYVFTGDALFVRGCGRTDFQEGSSMKLFESITNQLYTLDENTFVYPGHDYNGHLMTTIKEEMEYNPRINKNTTLEQFQHTMANLKLRPPKNLEHNVHENLTRA